jgi:nicotinamidase-related amidase
MSIDQPPRVPLIPASLRQSPILTRPRHFVHAGNYMAVKGLGEGRASIAATQICNQGRLQMKRAFVSMLALAAAAGVGLMASPAGAQTIIDEWANVKAPPPPALKAVTPDPKTTALLVMDLVKQTCNDERRPRCVASVPKIAKLVAEARAKGAMVIYTTVPPVPVADTLPALAPKSDEPVVVAWVDKFMLGNQDTGLEKMLKDRGITTLITVGTAAHGAVLYTSSTAALRGFNVVVPVDGMSGDGQNTYIEQYVAFNFTSAPIVSPKITLTKIDMIKF